MRLRPLLDSETLAESRLAPHAGAQGPRPGLLEEGRQARDVLVDAGGKFAAWRRGGRAGRGAGVKEKRMLPILGQPAQQPVPPTERVEDECCSDGAEEALVATPATRESNPEIPDGRSARTVLRVEGMDCASCAATVEKGVVRLPGVYRAAVNFAAGRLDAEHDPELAVEEIEKAVRDAGYRVAKTEDAKRAPFWRTPRAISVFASALLFALGLGLSVAGAPEVARAGAYLTAIVVGGMPIFRAALAGAPPGHERADERGHGGGGRHRAVGRGGLGGGALRCRQRPASLRDRPHSRRGAGARAADSRRGPRQEGRLRGTGISQ